MPSLSLAGPSSQLRSYKAECRRVVNWMPVQIESGTGKGGQVAYLKQVPGKVQKASLGDAVRGAFVSREVLYVVAGSKLYRIASDWTATELGTLSSGSGPVDFADNTTQLCIVDGPVGYVYDLDSGVFSTIGTNWPGSARVSVMDGFGIYCEPGTEQFFVSSNQDFTVIDALSYASAEGTTGNIIAHIVKHREALILKERTGEVWYSSGGADFPLARNDGAAIEFGCAATHSLQKIAGTAFWLSKDENGSATVSAMTSYTPQRVASHALEEVLSSVSDLSGAYAFTYQQEGLSFYVLQVPGLPTTWVYELASGIWHERGEWVDGDLKQDLATCHAYAYGVHVVGGSDGKLYQLDPTSSQSAGAELCRDWISPHNAQPNASRLRFGSLQVDCEVGEGLAGSDAKLMLRYSDDGGKRWSNWRYLTLGHIGQYQARARATMLGSGRDRVWHIRVTDAVQCNPVSIIVDSI